MKNTFLKAVKNLAAPAVLMHSAAAYAQSGGGLPYDANDDRRDTKIQFIQETVVPKDKSEPRSYKNPGQELQLSLGNEVIFNAFLDLGPEKSYAVFNDKGEQSRPGFGGVKLDTLSLELDYRSVNIEIGKVTTLNDFVFQNAAPGYKPLISADEASRDILGIDGQTGVRGRFVAYDQGSYALIGNVSATYNIPLINGYKDSATSKKGGLGDTLGTDYPVPSFTAGADYMNWNMFGGRVIIGGEFAAMAGNPDNATEVSVSGHGKYQLRVSDALYLTGLAEAGQVVNFEGKQGQQASVGTVIGMAEVRAGYDENYRAKTWANLYAAASFNAAAVYGGEGPASAPVQKQQSASALEVGATANLFDVFKAYAAFEFREGIGGQQAGPGYGYQLGAAIKAPF